MLLFHGFVAALSLLRFSGGHLCEVREMLPVGVASAEPNAILTSKEAVCRQLLRTWYARSSCVIVRTTCVVRT